MAWSKAGDRYSYSSRVYALMVLLFCLWILSLPIFPTQDGPIHRYYTHILDTLLQHQQLYGMYQIRHPFPPYATHYAVLLLLSKMMSYDLAEKVFVCLCLVSFAYGLRACAKAAGPAGEWLSLLAAPLFLQWALMMGFFNYYLATALFLWAGTFWQVAGKGRPRYWAAFLAIVILLTFTHPIPLLLLVTVCGLDLCLDTFASAPGRARENVPRVVALIFASAALLFPLSLVDRQHAGGAIEAVGWHPHFVTSSLLLMGVSPYNTRSTAFWINGYRLGLYLLLGFCVLLALRSFRQSVRQRTFGFAATLTVSVVLLALALLIMPDKINGTVYFATRLTAMLWVGAIVGASAHPRITSRVRPALLAAAGAALTAMTLITAEVYLRPVAEEVHAEEVESLPPQQNAIVLIGYGLQDYVRFHRQLAFNPYQWAPVLAPALHNDVVLDSPWLAQSIAPLTAAPNSPLTVTEITDAPFNKADPPKAYGRSLPATKERATVATAQMVLYTGTPEELSRGLSIQLDADEAARFQCSTHPWYLVCLTRPN